MVMRQRGGTKQNQKGMLNVFQSAFSRSEENCTCKNWEDSANIWQMCAIHTVMSTDSTVLLLLTKQSRKINAMRRVVFLKSSALSWHKIWRSLLTNWIHCIAAKNHNLSMKRKWKDDWINKENAVKLIVHGITCRDEIWGGWGGGCVKWRDSGGGGGAPFVHF
jgi:hypothetical protein